MREQGIILRYKNIPQLKDKIFVNPAWLTDCIYKVLDYSVIESEGEFDRTHLEKISQTIQPQISADELLALLKDFNLIFEIERMDKKWFICPQFLPSEIKGKDLYSVESHRKSKKIQYSFTLSYPKFLPVSTFLKFLAKHGKNHIHYWYSKNELLFIEKDKAVDTKCIRTKEERSITISVQDKDSKTSQRLFEELLNIDFPSDLRVSVNEGNDFVEVKKLQDKIKKEAQATQIESIENKSLNIQDFWFLFGKETQQKNEIMKNNALKNRFEEATEIEIPALLEQVKAQYSKIPSYQRGTFNQLKSEFADPPNNFRLSSWKSRFSVWLSNLSFEVLENQDEPVVLSKKQVNNEKMTREDIFISYSHHEEDQPYFDEVQRQLKTLRGYGLKVHIWDDPQIRTGDVWLEEIRKGLAKTKVAILLVSQNFLGSKFINETEIPAFLDMLQSDGGKLMPVLLRKVPFQLHPILKNYQFLNANNPLN